MVTSPQGGAAATLNCVVCKKKMCKIYMFRIKCLKLFILAPNKAISHSSLRTYNIFYQLPLRVCECVRERIPVVPRNNNFPMWQKMYAG